MIKRHIEKIHVTLSTLTVENDDYIHYGDLTIQSGIILKNADLIVSGKLSFLKDCKIVIYGSSSISAEDLESKELVDMEDGDIFVARDLVAYEKIRTEGDIDVGDSTDVENIICKEYNIGNSNKSKNVLAEKCICIGGENRSNLLKSIDIYIEGYSISEHLKATDSLYLGSGADLRGFSIYAKAYLCDAGVKNCGGIYANSGRLRIIS